MTGSQKSAFPAKAKLSEKEYMRDAIQYVLTGNEPGYLFSVGKKLRLLQGPDAIRCQEIQRLLLDYIKGSESKPISIVVFGPPGSGKSFYVKELLKSLRNRKLNEEEENSSTAARPPKEEETFASLLGEQIKINLAQLYTPLDLGKRFHVERDQKINTKAFFFDEFDSSLEGVSLGWLRWFLAPMQDGEFFYENKIEEIGKSIFIFAGGTAATFDEFQERTRIDLDAYHEKKVPDFISRLRGYIDVRGINEPGEDRPARRALILRNVLDNKGASIEKDSIESLLSNAHYIHGTRSMEALIEMSPWKKGEPFDIRDDLPPQRLMELHVSRGALNGRRVGVSAGLNESNKDFLIKLSGKLFENGADLAYGGNFVPKGTLDAMIDAAKKTPEDLLEREEKRRIRNYLGYPAYHDPELVALNQEVEDQVAIRALKTFSDSECQDLGLSGNYFPARPRPEKKETEYVPKRHLAWSLSLFRMRVHMIQDLSALIVFGGKDDGQSWGRFSGIAEEVMLALAMNKPVYVLGKAGGAALAIGKLLGLDETLVNPDTCLADIGSIEHSPIYKHYKHAFVLPEQPNLPRTVAEVRNYLFEHGVTSSVWPWNGLTPEQNRLLFKTELDQEDETGDTKDKKKSCISLIIEGLTRLDWKKQSRNSDQTKTTGRAHSAG